MLRIQVQLNSASGEVLAFKTCCGLKLDSNLEVLITNLGQTPVTVLSRFDLVFPDCTERFSALLPTGEVRIAPGEVKALYGQLDEGRFQRAEALVFQDVIGNRYPVKKVSANLAASADA